MSQQLGQLTLKKNWSDLIVALTTGLQFLPKQSLIMTSHLCNSVSAWLCSGQITGIALGVPAGFILCLVLFFLGLLYHRGLAIRRKRAMRRYLESGEVRLQRPFNLVSCCDYYIYLLSERKETTMWEFFLFCGRALSHWAPGRKAPRFMHVSWGPQSWKKSKLLAQEFLAQWTRYLSISFTFTDHPLIYLLFLALLKIYRIMKTGVLYISLC